jgi:hypothetical protein
LSTESRASHPPVWQHAHFSRTEIESVRHAFRATLDVVKAATIIAPAIATQRIRAEIDTGRMLAALCGGYPDPLSTDAKPTRAKQLEMMRFHRERAIKDSLPAALKAVKAGADKPITRRAADALEDAIFAVGKVDPALDYADPTPVDLLTLTIGDANGQPLTVRQTIPAVVGPHGIYDRAISMSHWMTHYARDMVTTLTKMLDARKYAGKRGRIRQTLGLYIPTQVWQYDCLAKIGGIIDDPRDRFCSMLYVGDTLWARGPKPGLPAHWFEMENQLIRIVSDDPQVHALFQAHGDMWLHGNLTIEGIFEENEPIRKRCN